MERKELQKMKKQELIDYILYECLHVDDAYSVSQYIENYDQGYDAGYYEAKREGKRSFSQEDLSRIGDNIISFSLALERRSWEISL